MNGTSNGKSVASPKNKKFRFNFVDAALIIIVILAIVALIYVFSPDSWFKGVTKTEERNITYTVEIIGVDEDFIYKINEGDTVGDAVSKSTIGKVSVVDRNTKYYEYGLYEVVEVAEDGTETKNTEFGAIEYDGKNNLIVSIEVNADYVKGDGYSVNSTRIAVGEKLSLKFPEFTCEGYCIGIRQN